MTTLWKDLIHIPERLRQDDFVLNLAQGVNDDRVRETVDSYVVTETIAKQFDAALELVHDAIEGRRRRAAFVHGSFGSGKSHFMAVLHLILAGNTYARSIVRLQPIVAKHDAWLQGRRFLLMALHFGEAPSIESRLFTHFARELSRRHPDAPVPPVFVGNHVLADANKLRASIGDAAFFAMLNGGSQPIDDLGLGGFGTTWDAARYDAAASAAPGEAERQALLSTLATHVYSQAIGVAGAGTGEAGETPVDLNTGLTELARSAQQLGYDGIVFFIDELVLWLMHSAGNHDRIARETPKLVQFVEGEAERSPVPIVSFIARQRDFDAFLGDAQYLSDGERLKSALSHMGQRFSTIQLEDRDLAPIVQDRVLRPIDEAAQRRIVGEFRRLWGELDASKRNALLGGIGDVGLFERVFPFSPALVETLVGLSSLLQRERTALKLLVHLLVRHRNTLKLGDLVPVGAVWEVLEEASEPFSLELRRQFERARRLWAERIDPMLRQRHGLPLEGPAPETPSGQRYRTDALLAQTLLLAALDARGIKSLNELTASRLVHLNYGTLLAELPGEEVTDALSRLRDWAQQVPEIQIGEAADPRIALRLTEVDPRRLLDVAINEDNKGQRSQRIKRLLFESVTNLGADQGEPALKIAWRGRDHMVPVRYINVRTASNHTFANNTRPTLYVDYPFDEDESRGPGDDQQRVTEFRETYEGRCWAIAWLPYFLTEAGGRLVGELVLAEVWLQRREQYLTAVAPEHRTEAVTLIESIAARNRGFVLDALKVAYGLVDENNTSVHRAGAHQVIAPLLQGATFQRPDAADFGEALNKLAEQLLAARYPDAPPLPNESFSAARLKRVATELRRAIETGEPSWLIEDAALRRDVLAVAKPLGLVAGDITKNRVQILTDWVRIMNRNFADGPAGHTVAELRAVPELNAERTGLSTELQDVVLLAWAAMSGSVFALNATTARTAQDVGVGALAAGLYVVAPRLPDDETWAKATQRSHAVFGVAETFRRTPSGTRELAQRIVNVLTPERRKAAVGLPAELAQAGKAMGLDEATMRHATRFALAAQVCDLVERLDRHNRNGELDATALLETLALAPLTPPLDAVGRAFKSAHDVFAIAQALHWDTLATWAHNPTAPREALDATNEVRAVLSAGEHERPLGDLRRTQDRIVAMLQAQVRAQNVGASGGTPSAPPPEPNTTVTTAIGAPAVGASGRTPSTPTPEPYAADAATIGAPSVGASGRTPSTPTPDPIAAVTIAQSTRTIASATDVESVARELNSALAAGRRLRVTIEEIE